MSIRQFGRYSVETSNEEKVLFADSGLSKGALMDYYDSVSEHFLRHAANRPLTMQRFPDGIDGDGFFQKQIGNHFPDWIHRVRIDTEQGEQEQVVCSNKATLVYLTNQACVTSHLFLSRIDRLRVPDRLIFDLDPSSDDFDSVRRAARRCKALLAEIDLVCFVKTTGSRGLHVVVPLRRDGGFDDVRAFAQDLAALLARRYPRELTTEQRKSNRRGRLFLDVGRNAFGQTAVAPYSVRALPGAPVATPVDWDELDDRSLHSRSFHVGNVGRRLEQHGDAWRRIGRSAQSLSRARQRLRSVIDAG